MQLHTSLLRVMRRDWRDVIDVDGRLVRLGIRDGWDWGHGVNGEGSRRHSVYAVGHG